MDGRYKHYAPAAAIERFQQREPTIMAGEHIYTFPWGHMVEQRLGVGGMRWLMRVALVQRVKSATWSSRFQVAHDEHVAEEMAQFLSWRVNQIRFDDYIVDGEGPDYFIESESVRVGQLARLWIAERLLPQLWPRVLLDVCGIPPSAWNASNSS